MSRRAPWWRVLRELIRIPSVNPPSLDRPDEELLAARYLAGVLEAAGLEPEVIEPVPDAARSTCGSAATGPAASRCCSSRTSMSCPRHPSAGRHAPFDADLADGYVYGRGAVDMKNLVAMELAVVLRLAGEARAAGLDPARDPIPGLRRDVLFTCTADEEAGGQAGAAWIVENRPEWLKAAGAINESGAVSTTVAGVRFYPIGVAEKGYAAYRIHVQGTWGHGSMPREDNAVVLAAAVISSLAGPETTRLTPVMSRFLDIAAEALPAGPARVARAIAAGDDALSQATLDGLCDRRDAIALRALLRDTISPDVVHAGVKYNVIPGDAVIEVDCRVLPGTSEAAMRARARRTDGPGAGGRVPRSNCWSGASPWRRRPTETCSRPWRVSSESTIPTASRCRAWSRSRPTPSTRPISASRPTASRPSSWTPTSGCSIGSTGWTNGSASPPCAGVAGPVRRRPTILRLRSVAGVWAGGTTGRPVPWRRVAGPPLGGAGRPGPP